MSDKNVWQQLLAECTRGYVSADTNVIVAGTLFGSRCGHADHPAKSQAAQVLEKEQCWAQLHH